MAEQPQVKILTKALRVLALFTREQPEWGVTAASREMDMSKSTVHRILRVLEEHGYLSRNPDTRRFRLGLAGIELGWRAQEGLELRRIALPIMQQVSALSGETVLLQVVSPEGDRVVCIERVQQRHGLRLILDVGATAPLYAGCSSKVLLAYLGDEIIDSVLRGGLRRVTAHTIIDPKAIRAQLAEIRRNGYAVSFEETDEGVAGVSVPVRDARDHVIGGLSISGPMTRVNASTIEHYAGIARDAAFRISASLGHQPSRLALRGPCETGTLLHSFAPAEASRGAVAAAPNVVPPHDSSSTASDGRSEESAAPPQGDTPLIGDGER